MITATSTETAYKTLFTNEIHQGISDTTEKHGGSHCGFRPHELLEAALATCMNMWLKMYADKRGLVLEQIKTKISIDRSDPEKVVFGGTIDLEGDLSEGQKNRMIEIATTCPVHRTLGRKIVFTTPTLEKELS